jgi:N-acylneuraminate cytidylyltransferase
MAKNHQPQSTYLKKASEVIAIIPARGGSKGLPRKNIIDLAGKPLIAYSILAAKYSKYIDRIIVSTEDEEIAKVAEDWGAEVPFLRPVEMAKDDTNVGDVVAYVIHRLGGHTANKVFVILFPTSPFRNPKFIDQMLEVLDSGYSSVTTVKAITVDRNFIYILDNKNNNSFINIFGKGGYIPNWKHYYRPYAAFHATSIQKYDRHYFHVLKDKCMLIDIDTLSDLKWAESIIQANLFNFGF